MLHKLSRLTVVLAAFMILSSLFLPGLSAQTNREPTQIRATKFELRDHDIHNGGKLYITVAGRERKIDDNALEVWLINDGRQVVFSGRDGSGGFEDEGQSLRIYDVRTRRTRKILSEFVFVTAVQEVRLSTGAIALLVKLGDGGLGGSYFAVADPNRGEVFFRRLAEVTAINGDEITLAFYRADDFDAINDARGWKPGPSNQVISTTKVAAYKTEKHDLKKVLQQRVIYNRRDDLADSTPPPKAKEVKIFLWEVNSNKEEISLVPVIRRIGGANVLKLTMDWLFGTTLSKEEQERGLVLPSFGMKLEGVMLTNGVALVRFSQPPIATNYGSQGPFVFAEAIEKTARQFPTVKKVEICAVGETMIDAQLEKPFPRCPK
jgi:hypothetical protein